MLTMLWVIQSRERSPPTRAGEELSACAVPSNWSCGRGTRGTLVVLSAKKLGCEAHWQRELEQVTVGRHGVESVVAKPSANRPATCSGPRAQSAFSSASESHWPYEGWRGSEISSVRCSSCAESRLRIATVSWTRAEGAGRPTPNVPNGHLLRTHHPS
eukprot:4062705-Prymnesium_polylepis.1